VISRSGLGSQGAEGGGYLEAGDMTGTIGYRHVYSHEHFSGPVRQDYRFQLGTPIQQKTNMETLSVSYQLTPRINLQGVVPFFSASRRSQAQYATLHTSGLSDISFGASTWIRSPKSPKAKTNNLQLGASLLVPTGKDRIQNNVITTFGGPQSLQTPDYSAQPGQGTWGLIMSWQAFQDIGNQTILFCGGNYVMTQGGYKNFFTSHGGTRDTPPAPTPGKTEFDAIQDQYLIEIGASHPAPGIKGMAITLSIRDEGVPAHNIIGDNLGFRRPGFSINLTPGLIYTRGNHMLQVAVGKAMFRDRTKSVAEEVNNVHEGDAAFANYVWMAAYTLRLPKKHNEEEASAAPNPLAPRTVPGEKFKPFTLKTMDGSKKTLQDYSNKVTLVSFFFPRCPYCNVELPEVQKLHEKYKDKGLSTVWINIVPEEESLIRGWQAEHNFNVPVLVGGTQDGLMKDYRLTSTPTTYLLSEKGEVLFKESGYKKGDEKILDLRISQALNLE
jgi:peroxiredoxin